MFKLFNDIARKTGPRFVDHRGYAWGQHGYIGYNLSPTAWVGRLTSLGIATQQMLASNGNFAALTIIGLLVSEIAHQTACMTQWTVRNKYMVEFPLDRLAQEKTALLIGHHDANNEKCHEQNIKNIHRGGTALAYLMAATAIAPAEWKLPLIFANQAVIVFMSRFVDGLRMTNNYRHYTICDPWRADQLIAEAKVKRTAPVSAPVPSPATPAISG